MIVNESAPGATVVPVLVYADVGRAVAWLCEAFGFAERLRVEHEGSVAHAQLVVADGALMLGRQGGPYRAPRRGEFPQYVHVTVPDVDAHFEQAKRAGAQIVAPPHDTPFGERQYTAEDPEGHLWAFSQHIANVSPERWGARLAAH
jgi:uncharacterized glyoxalase superfamily protein PhnB